jgi:predicted ABC-type ATPase
MRARDGVVRRIRDKVASADRVLVVVAGPNGAGKTTFVETFIEATGLLIVNADAIAAILSPATPNDVAYEAAQVAETVRRDLLTRNISFCMETVFSDREGLKVDFLRQARSRGYVVSLIFIGLESSSLAVARVIARLEAGGHDVPDEKIIARFSRSLENLRSAVMFVDHAFIFDNSSAQEPYRWVAELRSGRIVRKGHYQPRWWSELRRA